jgi:hypothetical protein
MALDLGQVAVGTAATFVTRVPPGPFALTLTASSAVAIGVGTTTTFTSGALINVNSAVTYTGFSGSTGAALYAVASTSSTVSYHLCTNE